MKTIEGWHLQEKENIYDAFVGWDCHRFVCLMKDNTIHMFSGINDETYNGEISTHVDCWDDDYDDVDRIVMWIEVPMLDKK